MIYEARCIVCGKKRDYSRMMKDRDNTPICCNQPMKRIFSPTMGHVDTPAAKR